MNIPPLPSSSRPRRPWWVVVCMGWSPKRRLAMVSLLLCGGVSLMGMLNNWRHPGAPWWDWLTLAPAQILWLWLGLSMRWLDKHDAWPVIVP